MEVCTTQTHTIFVDGFYMGECTPLHFGMFWLLSLKPKDGLNTITDKTAVRGWVCDPTLSREDASSATCTDSSYLQALGLGEGIISVHFLRFFDRLRNRGRLRHDFRFFGWRDIFLLHILYKVFALVFYIPFHINSYGEVQIAIDQRHHHNCLHGITPRTKGCASFPTMFENWMIFEHRVHIMSFHCVGVCSLIELTSCTRTLPFALGIEAFSAKRNAWA